VRFRKTVSKEDQARGKWSTPNQLYMEVAVRRGECISPPYTESRHADPDIEAMQRNRCIAAIQNSPCLDAYKVLRTRIRGLMQEKGSKTLMITSALPGEGKTLTAINLALTCAKEFDQTVLLVDCDFQRQDVHKYLGIESGKGLMDFLIRETPLKELIIWPGIEKMTFVSGGATVRESTEIMGSSRMHGFVKEIRGRYPDRLVIFDAPPVLPGADAIVLSSLVDSIAMVIAHGRTSMKVVSNALELIPKDKFLGFILTRDSG